MCVIIHLAPGVMVPFEKLENAVYNNWHGFGLILKDGNGRMDAIKRCHKDGNDPKEIYDLLEDNKDIERILHLRFATAGAVNMDNAHPFLVFNSDKRKVWFMHNGTLHDYKPTHYPSGHQSQWGQQLAHEQAQKSDSYRYGEEFLGPLLSKFTGENGKADIQDPFVKTIIEKNWAHGSRGILVANDLESCFISRSSWKTIQGEDEKTVFLASNDDYFNKLTRGPEFESRKRFREQQEREEREAAAQKTALVVVNKQQNEMWPLHLLDDMKKGCNRSILGQMPDIFSDFDLYTNDGLSELALLTTEECESFVEDNPADAAHLMVYLTNKFDEVFRENQLLLARAKKAEEKHAKASRRIATAKAQSPEKEREVAIG